MYHSLLPPDEAAAPPSHIRSLLREGYVHPRVTQPEKMFASRLSTLEQVGRTAIIALYITPNTGRTTDQGSIVQQSPKAFTWQDFLILDG